MTTTTESMQEPWKELKEILQKNDKHQLERFLDTLSASETARAISRMDSEDQILLFTLLETDEAADIISEIPEEEASGVMEELPPSRAASIVDEMHSDDQADLLNNLSKESADAILEILPDEEADEIRQLMTYPEDTAGGLMITEYLFYRSHLKVEEVREDLRQQGEKYADYTIQYAYITSKTEKLLGVLPLRDLLLASNSKSVEDLMISNPLKVLADTPLKELEDFFSEHQFLGVPVTDDKNNLLGVVERESVEEAVSKRTNKTFLNFSGIVGGEEFRSMPLISRSSRRLSWLSINIVLNIIAASVIAFYQDTLEKAIILAVFLPIISDMSGCSGNQAVAVSMRELTLGLVHPRELGRVFFKEAMMGILNGLVLGCILGGAALLWKGNPYLGLVVGGALSVNTLVAVCLGGSIPLILNKMKIDPALASGPLLTTITDMCGFFFVLSFASIMLPWLSG